MPSDYRNWTEHELRQAEVTADSFLRENTSQIVDTLQAKVRFLEFLIQRLNQRHSSLNQRLDCFARIAEVSQYMREDAQGFFELASQPIVARLLHSLEQQSGDDE